MSQLTVFIPTLNCMQMLPEHLASMRPWLHLASEVIVVDSFSTDGTLEYLRRELADFPVSFHSCERGLYQCWNYGIRLASSPWLYISTVGDSIGLDLLQHLIALGEAAEADVVLSRPQFIFDPGQPVRPMHWAIDKIIETANPFSDCLLTGVAAHYFALLHARTSALLGSSASNLYRTAHLQQYPFPTEYGSTGDGAWGLMHAIHSRIACTSRPGSTFRIHEKPHADASCRPELFSEHLYALGIETDRREQHRPDLATLRITDLLQVQDEKPRYYAELKHLRKSTHIWFLHPRIWTARKTYKQTRTFSEYLTQKNLEQIRLNHISPVKLAVPALA